uniref:broad substrate specificity ATP-binding cassette transporter ABCG2-like n=1 Tax=Styela clava TaxID=7725 RepID=UPI001939BAA1|nr:broad substrate specificity ATP-binding cassette transporter ABCG2-like [Styela clava]
MRFSSKRKSYTLDLSDMSENGIEMVTRFSSKVGMTSDNGVAEEGRQNNNERGAVISFHNVYYSVQTKEGCCTTCKEGTKKEIIKGISGIMKPGLNAIMGPTGSGKSSLLDILAGRKDPAGLDGLLLVDGSLPPSDFRRISGYVVQNDVIMGTLTVRECLWFSANLRLPRSISKQEKERRIDRILNELGLTECADTKVGTTLIRGVSGGERKRTAIGIELITEPTVLFLDEPTTGLDASTANAVMTLLKRLSERGRTIICSIHQPRFSIYRLFDSLTLLSLGRMAYHGPSSRALPYFSELGFQCEEHNNPADFFLDVINGDSTAISEYQSTKENIDNDGMEEPKSNSTSEELSNSFLESDIQKECKAELAVIEKRFETVGKHTVRGGDAYVTPFYYQFGMLSQRAFRNIIRNPIASVGNLVLNLIIGVIFGALYYQLDYTLTGVQNRLGVLFFITTNLLFGAISSLELFVQERDIFIHEYVSGYYRIIAYFLAKMTADLIPMRTVAPIIFCSVTYWMVGLKPEAGAFFFFMLVVLLTGYASVSIGLFYSSSFETFGVATLFLTMTYVFSIIFAGLLVNINSIFPWLAWLEYLSIARYSFVGMSINELRGENYTSCSTGALGNEVCTITTGDDILVNNLAIGTKGEPITDWDQWQNVVALGSIALGMFTLTYVQLVRMKTYT